ncbi:uncharacterized protein LOC124142399 isoform X2 [Haliotis rufescens]|uniref:uncharacterized protein LOC124142399 isoform X2 n=1 Tax=Haliotis rufescens TaxID=6454 RepID=UPI00201E9375|nr:uncharacterized protein LOC124142399 isoform X2 [Haliotis rufescens]
MYQEDYDSRTLSGRPSELHGLQMKIADKYNVHEITRRLQLDGPELSNLRDRSDMTKYQYSFELERRVLQRIDVNNLMQSAS